jgi:uncharacterized membrane protein YfcA
VSASARLATVMLKAILWLQLGHVGYKAPAALLLGALAGAPLAVWVTRQLPRRATVDGIASGALALATMGLRTA